MIKVRVPATSANLGPGFDTLGIALGLYNSFSFDETGDSLVILGCDEKYAGSDNLAYVSYLKALEYKGADVPKGLKIEIESDVPVSRGLGSSSTLIAAGIFAANELRGLGLSKEEMLILATELEGHPDNAAPAIYGGLTAASIRDGKTLLAHYPVSENLQFTVLIPDFETSTKEARAILPAEIKRTDGVYTVSCLALLFKAFETGNSDLLSACLDDRLHQPYRKTLIPGFDEIREMAIANGADGLIISGSGSTLLCIGGDSSFEEKMRVGLASFKGNWIVKSLKPDFDGTVRI